MPAPAAARATAARGPSGRSPISSAVPRAVPRAGSAMASGVPPANRPAPGTVAPSAVSTSWSATPHVCAPAAKQNPPDGPVPAQRRCACARCPPGGPACCPWYRHSPATAVPSGCRSPGLRRRERRNAEECQAAASIRPRNVSRDPCRSRNRAPDRPTSARRATRAGRQSASSTRRPSAEGIRPDTTCPARSSAGLRGRISRVGARATRPPGVSWSRRSPPWSIPRRPCRRSRQKSAHRPS